MKEPAKNPWFFHENGRFIEFLEIARTGANSVASSNISESISLQSDTIAKLAFF
jgi:hypothetical protein